MPFLIVLTFFIATLSPAAPRRVVSTFVGADEILWALKPESIAGLSNLARNPSYCHYAQDIPKTIPMVGDSLEYLLSLRPDLVIAASFTRPEIRHLLETTKTPHLILKDFRGPSDIVTMILTIGAAIDEKAAAGKLAEAFKKGLSDLKGQCGPRRKFLSHSSDLLVYGRDTTFDALIRAVGGTNEAESILGFAHMSTETLLTLTPDIVVASGETDAAAELLPALRSAHGWRHLKAVQQGHLIMVPSRYLSSVSHTFLEGAKILCQEAKKWPG